jgi:transcriptional regulator with XRE-family HTH domain
MQQTLKDAREEKEWTLETLAAKSGVNKSTISRLERGETLPMHDTVKNLERALGLKRGTLVFEAVA